MNIKFNIKNIVLNFKHITKQTTSTTMPFYGHHTCYPILTRPPPFIKCGPELYNIIKRNWAPDELWNFENLMYKHGFSTMNEVDINNLTTFKKGCDKTFGKGLI